MTQTNGGPGSGAGPEDAGDNADASRLPGGHRLEKIAGSANTRAGSAYQGAFESVFAIVIGTGLGYWADTKFGTSPRWLIVGAIVGFAAFVLRLARMARLVAESASEDSVEPASEAEDESPSKDREESDESHGAEEPDRAE